MKEQLKKSFAELKDGMLSIAQAMKDWNTDEAVANIEKTVALLKTSEEAIESIDEDTPKDPVVGDVTDPVVGWEAEPQGEELTKAQQVSIKKYVDMYLSWEDVLKLLELLKNVDLTSLVKTVEDLSKSVQSLETAESKQLAKTSTWSTTKSVRDGLDMV